MKKGRLLYKIVFGLRVGTAPFIFFYPLPVVSLSILLDAIDAEFASMGVLTKDEYQKFDKTLDFWWSIFAMAYTLFAFPAYSLFLFILFVYRALGFLFFQVRNERKYLFWYPNFFENAFLFFFFATGVNVLNFLLVGKTILFSLTVLFLAKIGQEYFLHVKQLSVREDIFKIKRAWKEDDA